MGQHRIDTAHVAPIATDIPELEAFRVIGSLTSEDVSALSQHVLGIFERTDKVDLLISFDSAGDDRIPAYNREAVKRDVMALRNLRNLAVVNAPERVHALLDTADKTVPVAIRSFHSESEALDWLKASRDNTG